MRLIFGGFVALLVLALVVLIGPSNFVPPPSKTPAPEGFDKSQFPDIAELEQVPGVRLTKLEAFGEYYEHQHIADHGITYFAFSAEGKSEIVLFDARGSLLGQLSMIEYAFPMGPHFIDLDGYHTVTAKQIGPYVPHQLIEESLTDAQLSQLVDEATYYRYYSPEYVPAHRPEHAAKLETHILFRNGVWQKYVGQHAYIAWKVGSFDNLLDKHHKILREQENDGGLILTHFDQQTYKRKVSAKIGSPNGQDIPAQWLGTGYYTLMVGDVPFRFSVANDHLSGSRVKFSSVSVESLNGIDLIVLSHRNRVLYVVGPEI
ncbi:MAG: hypothetical protein OXC60_04140 [Litoreibacter sp.]|nr:hypothetical protein [Litoreibacter sp.]